MSTSSNPTFSFEFFPPNTPEGREKLRVVTAELAALKPKFFSVTYGAGGSTRDRTLETVLEIQQSGHQAAPHISCIASTHANIRDTLEGYRSHGIQHLVALRGDLPSGLATAGEFHYAFELVDFIRREFGRHFFIEIAAYPEYHPQARDALEDLRNFKRKVDAGATRAITQFFFDTDDYLRFRDRCVAGGIGISIVPGILPITRFPQVTRFAARCGARIPDWLAERFAGLDDDPDTRRLIAANVAIEQVSRLRRHGVTEFHFYTLNRAELTYAICHALGLRPAAAREVAQ